MSVAHTQSQPQSRGPSLLDPANSKKMIASRSGDCAHCTRPIKAGDPIYWDPKSRAACHQRCGNFFSGITHDTILRVQEIRHRADGTLLPVNVVVEAAIGDPVFGRVIGEVIQKRSKQGFYYRWRPVGPDADPSDTVNANTDAVAILDGVDPAGNRSSLVWTFANGYYLWSRTPDEQVLALSDEDVADIVKGPHFTPERQLAFWERVAAVRAAAAANGSGLNWLAEEAETDEEEPAPAPAPVPSSPMPKSSAAVSPVASPAASGLFDLLDCAEDADDDEDADASSSGYTTGLAAGTGATLIFWQADSYEAPNWAKLAGTHVYLTRDVGDTVPEEVSNFRHIPDGTYTIVMGVDEDAHYRTLRVRTVNNPHNKLHGKTIVSYLRGRDNETDYTGFAFIEKGYVKFWRNFQNNDELADAVQVLVGDPATAGERYAIRSKRCFICGRKLTVPASLHRGMGPDCASRTTLL